MRVADGGVSVAGELWALPAAGIEYVRHAVEHAPEGIPWFAIGGIDETRLADVLAAIHAAGLHLIAWTVNEPGRARDLLAMGVDAITTDAIDRIAP